MEPGYTSMDGSHKNGTVLLDISNQTKVSYLNQRLSDYLTPSGSTSSQQSHVRPPPHNTVPIRSWSLGNQIIENKPLPNRASNADSGIETESVRSPLSSTSTANQRNSTIYEYIDPRNVHYNHGVPGIIFQGESDSSGISSATVATGTTAYSGDALSDSDDAIRFHDGTRRRINPMYEALERSATRLYAETCHCKMQLAAQKQIRFLFCAFIIVIIIVVILLAVTAYMLFVLVPDIKSHVNRQENRIKEVELDLSNLHHKDISLHSFLTRNKSDSDALQIGSLMGTIVQLNDSIVAFDTQLNGSLRAINNQIQDVRLDLQQQIYNISLIPGPQGSSGTDNLNCTYSSFRSVSALPGPPNFVSWKPELDVLQNKMVLSAACEVLNGTQQSLEARKVSPDIVQYRCRCGGSLSVADRRTCVIHLVMCKR